MSGNNEDKGNTPIIIMGCVLGFLSLCWYLFSVSINTAITSVAKINLEIIAALTEMGQFGELIANVFAPGISNEIIGTLKAKFYSTNPRFMDGSETILYLEFLGQNIRPFLVILMAVSFIRVYKEQKHRSLKKKYNLDDILKVGSQYNPHLNPVICQDLVKSDPDIGPLARDKSPLILAIENRLITVFDIDHIGNNTNRILTPVFGKKNIQKDETIIIKNSYTDTLEGLPLLHGRCVLNKEKAKTFFTEQLGPRYTGWKNMPLERRAFLAIAALFMKGVDSGGVAESIKLQRQINEDFSLKKVKKLTYLDENKINQILSENEALKTFQRLVNSHSYELTLITGFMEAARKKGKLYTSHMYWIKHTDRALWFTLENCGSQMPYSEAAAVRAHYLREENVQMGLDSPEIHSAIDGLEKFLGETEGWLAKVVNNNV